MHAAALRERRRLLVASASLQRVRLALEWRDLRGAAQPPPWAAPLLAGTLFATALVALVRPRARPDDAAPREPRAPRDPAWALWGARALALWRVAAALRRVLGAIPRR